MMIIKFKILVYMCLAVFFQNAALAGQSARNIILITISTLRADHVSVYRYDRETTRNFDDFAQNSILFKNAFSASSWMMPATGSIFTSLYPSEHGATHISKKLNSQCKTLAEILKANGYTTAGFCCNPRLSSEYGFSQGFDFYDDFSVSIFLQTLSFDDQQKPNINQSRTNHILNDSVMAWLGKNTSEKFFLFMHYYDNHWDYLPSEPYRSMYDPNYKGPIDGTEIAREPLYSNMPSDKDVQHIIALYDGQVHQTDEDLGQMLAFLKQHGYFENSIIIVMGDHGDAFYEHGHTSHHGIYEELIHIPLAIHIPGDNEKKVCESLVSGLDIMPTILDYADIEKPSICKGNSLKPLIDNSKKTINEYVRIEYAGGAVDDIAVLRGLRYKFCQSNDIFFCYDILQDPSESSPVMEKNFTTDMQAEFEKIEMQFFVSDLLTF